MRQGAYVQAGSTTTMGIWPRLKMPDDRFLRDFAVAAGGKRFIGIGNIDAVMRYERRSSSVGLAEPISRKTVHLHGIGAHDFAADFHRHPRCRGRFSRSVGPASTIRGLGCIMKGHLKRRQALRYFAGRCIPAGIHAPSRFPAMTIPEDFRNVKHNRHRMPRPAPEMAS
jgi:hypothetical protein